MILSICLALHYGAGTVATAVVSGSLFGDERQECGQSVVLYGGVHVMVDRAGDPPPDNVPQSHVQCHVRCP